MNFKSFRPLLDAVSETFSYTLIPFTSTAGDAKISYSVVTDQLKPTVLLSGTVSTSHYAVFILIE